MQSLSIDEARAAKQDAAALFSRFGKVVGVGITKLPGNGYGIKVNFQEQPTTPDELPQSVRGVPVRFEVVGRIRKLSVSAD
jgi:hypothetical protein